MRQALEALVEAGVEFIVVGGVAGALLGSPVTTHDLDIVHRRTPENIERLFRLLERAHAFHRFDAQKRTLPPTVEQLSGNGQLNLSTDLGDLDVLCTLATGDDYESLLPETEWLETDTIRILVLGLAGQIRIKRALNRPKDRLQLPYLIATLEERERRKK